MSTFYVHMFTTAGSGPDQAIQRAEAIAAEVCDERPHVVVEPYEKLGLYSHKIRFSVDAEQDTCLALFDRFRAEGHSGWSALPVDGETTLRHAGWDHRGTATIFVDPSVKGAFLGVLVKSGPSQLP